MCVKWPLMCVCVCVCVVIGVCRVAVGVWGVAVGVCGVAVDVCGVSRKQFSFVIRFIYVRYYIANRFRESTFPDLKLI